MSHFSHKLTNKKLADLLSDVKKVYLKDNFSSDCDLNAIWKLVVGEKIFELTRVLSFKEGVLLIQTQSSALTHLLARVERPKILARFKSDFPFLKVKSLMFRSG